jgi:type I pullulanase
MNYKRQDLGCTYSFDRSVFKVWSPVASDVRVQLYKTGSDEEEGAQKLESYGLSFDSNTGVWSVTVYGDLKNLYYTYLVSVNGVTKETQDVYSKAVGVNGKRSMVCNLEETNPDGWAADKHIYVKHPTDAVIWEVHVGDFSGSPSSGVSEENRGKYLAFTETGTTVDGEGKVSTCVDYLKELGITHVHLNPVYDFDSVDEAHPEKNEYNWGYDPANYNVPEGSYSSNPFDGNVRIREFKSMVKALHDAGIGVIMDVVYNHTSSTDSCFNRTYPDYYYRKNGDRFLNSSGCGNVFASEKEMARNYIVNSVTYWAKEYHIDGFRFDLMGCIDTTTMNLVRLALDEIDSRILIYGEPWTADLGDNGLSFEDACVKENAYKLSSRIAMFNDSFRNALKGNTDDASAGYIQGNNHNIYYVISGILACSSDTFLKHFKKPTQCVTYNSAHDNLTLWDKLLKSQNMSDYDTHDEHIIEMNKLSAALVFTSQGIPFILAGEEMARTKHGDHNSYKSPLSVNAIDWTRLISYKELVRYYKGLIRVRKLFTPFREPTTVTVSNTYFETDGQCIAYTIPNINHGEWDMIAMLFNNSSGPAHITLKSHTTLPHSWVIPDYDEEEGIVEYKRIDGNDINVPPMTTLLLIDDKSFDRLNGKKAKNE